jgi:branched chain amino acid efflux pump
VFESGSHGNIVGLIIVLAVVTYLTRIGGYLLLSRFKRIHPRVEAGLEAVPVAVMTPLIVPPAFSNGPAEAIAIIVVCLLSLRLGPIPTVALGLLVLVAGRGLL